MTCFISYCYLNMHTINYLKMHGYFSYFGLTTAFTECIDIWCGKNETLVFVYFYSYIYLNAFEK